MLVGGAVGFVAGGARAYRLHLLHLQEYSSSLNDPEVVRFCANVILCVVCDYYKVFFRLADLYDCAPGRLKLSSGKE